MALRRAPQRPEAVSFRLGPGRLYLDDIEHILAFLRTAAEKVIEAHYANREGEFWKGSRKAELQRAQPRMQLGDDVVAESVDDLRLAGPRELQNLRISAGGRFMMFCTLTPRFAKVTYYSAVGEIGEEAAGEIRKVVERRRIAPLAVWYEGARKWKLLLALVGAVVSAAFGITLPGAEDLLWVAGTLVGIVVGGAITEAVWLSRRGGVVVKPLCVSESRGFWTSARREAGLVAVAAVLGGVVVGLVQALLT